MSNTKLAAALVAVVVLGGCTAAEPEFPDDDRVRAADRTPDAAEPGEDGEAPAGEILHVTAVDIDFVEEELSAPAGAVTVELVNEGRIFHDFAIEELGGQVVVEAQPGETNTGNVTLEAGTYNYFCDVPGHRAAGMEGVLTVS